MNPDANPIFPAMAEEGGPSADGLVRLIGAVEAEGGLCAELLSVLRSEKRALVAADSDLLNETAKEKETVLLKIKLLEEERSSALADLCREMAIGDDIPDLPRLVERLPAPEAARLSKCHETLSALVASVQELNRSNGALLTHGLSLIRGSMRMLDQLFAPHAVYRRSGKVGRVRGPGRMLSGRV